MKRKGINTINIELKPKLSLSPRLYQYFNLLQLPQIELLQKIKQEIRDNPLIEMREAEGEVYSIEEELQGSTKEVEEYFSDSSDIGYNERDPNQDEFLNKKIIEGVISSEPTLHEYLTSQLHLAIDDEKLIEIGEIVISYIDERGYLIKTGEEIYKDYEGKYSIDDINKVIDIIRTFDPPGVGAYDLRDCLAIQIKQKYPDDTLLLKMIEEYFPLVASKKLRKLAKLLEVDVKQVKDMFNKITTLVPHPGYLYSNKKEGYIIPDIIVEKRDGDFYVGFNNKWIPDIYINRYYNKLLKSKKDKKLHRFLAEKKRRAMGLIDALEFRKKVMIAISEAIVRKQMDFFEKGIEHLKPMTMEDIAEESGVSLSTVSRVVKDKYIQTPFGIFEMKFLFSGGISKDNDGKDISSNFIMNLIKEIIENEDKTKPLSDSKIVEVLKNRGINISRRLVAKYRKKLKIPAANIRKRIK